MSNALDALMNMSNDDVMLYTSEPETEGYITIGSDRRITVPETLKRIAVQYDHNIETVTFDCPRYWDDHDMSKMIVYINYRLPNGDLGSYIAANITASGDRMTFDWTILKDVTQYKGNIAFLVCVKKTDSEGIEENHWNSELCTDMYISEGLEAVASVTYDYPDLVNQLLERMTTVEQINVQADEMQVLHDETLDAAEVAETARTEAVAVKESVEASEEHIRNSYANAIRNSVSGACIRVDDVSPIEHTVKTTVRSKNLFNTYTDLETATVNGITFVYNGDGTVTIDGTCDCSGTDTSAATRGFIPAASPISIKKGTTVTLSGINGVLDDGSYAFRIRLFTDTKTTKDNGGLQGDYYQTTTITVTEDCVIHSGHIQVGDGYTVDNVVINPQLEIGDTATEFTPYVDPSTATVTACGKNIFKLAAKTQTLNGVTCTVNTDGTVTVNGTAEKATFFGLGNVYPVEGARHRLSGCPFGGSFNTYILYIHNSTSGADIYDLGSGKVFTGVAGDLGLTIAVYAGTTVNNLKFYPMVTIGEEVEAFEPYVGSSYSPSSDGTVEGVASVSPMMCVYADKTGTIIDIEYNKDLNAVFDDINNLLELLLNGGA